MKYTIASGPVIIEDGMVLLDKHGKDEFWKFPGSSIKQNESLEQCAVERVKDELGIDVELIRPVKPMILWKDDEIIILIHYLAKRKDKTKEIKPGSHIREWKWISIDNLPDDVGPNIRPVLDAIKNEK